ncbi:enoyl-CoA hydratase-related protein [Calderihabitans maritimus]|uniref:short-chain-enoyl-CoA hydratase n=1 Tax=Calderihabitans maritimus TaxID=1246530 RepID=A0A1Z5HRR4_9FIRM|nr:enoyl-CoA hydratase-related protein [Calderihabitans maritimus]GAW92057.1 putative 3-hydroxybutyryl-CoA dehydratase [Calderihabitans maritimus]
MEKEKKLVKLEVEGKIAVITIDHPPVNALNAQVMAELDEALDQVASDKEIGVLIITGAGEKAFVAGADIRQFPELDEKAGRELSARGQAIFDKIEELAIPVICAINGYALGGGCELALACDIRVVAENAKLGQPEVNLAVIPGYGGTQRLPRLVGAGKAKQLIFTGDAIDAQEAYRIGLADELVPAGQALEKAKEMAKKILTKGPVAIRLCKEAINRGLQMPLKEGLALEAELFGKACATEDKNEGAKAFLEKRKPNFQGK